MVELPGMEMAEIGFVKGVFNSTGFVNSGSSAGAVKHFLSLEKSPVRQLHDDPDVFAAGFQIFSAGIPDETRWEFTPNRGNMCLHPQPTILESLICVDRGEDQEAQCYDWELERSRVKRVR